MNNSKHPAHPRRFVAEILVEVVQIRLPRVEDRLLVGRRAVELDVDHVQRFDMIRSPASGVSSPSTFGISRAGETAALACARCSSALPPPGQAQRSAQQP